MAVLQPLLPEKYSPLLRDGRGSQNLYLTALPRPLALQLADLLGNEVGALARAERIVDPPDTTPNPESVLWEEHLRSVIERDEQTRRPTGTCSSSLDAASLFRSRVQEIESHCRITRVDRPEHLRASHCKPWRDSDNAERLDGFNGLLLTPSIDHLFDRGFISFEDDGRLLVSPVAHAGSLEKMGVPTRGVLLTGSFRPEQAAYLEYHRDEVFLRSRVARAG